MKIINIYNKKIAGDKNELSEEEKYYFENILGGEYQVLHQLGRSGARTSTYLLEDLKENKCALKISNEATDKDWIDSQKKAVEKRDLLFNEYNGDIAIAKTISIGENYVLEPYLGVEFNENVYNKLSKNDKNKIEKDFADLLNFIHSKKVSTNIQPLGQCLNPSLEEVYDFFEGDLDEKDKIKLKQKIENFNSRDKSDELTVLTHSDIRSQNVLYDESTNKLAIIDFELAAYKNIYNDFVPYAAASYGMSYSFLNNVMKNYNKISEQKVDPNKVKLLHELGIFHEYGRCAMYRDTNEKDKPEIASKIKYYDNKIEEGFSLEEQVR